MIQVFRPSGNNSVDGVLSHFRASNEISKYVSVFSTETLQPYVPTNILDITNESYWASVQDGDKYVGLTFIQHSFNVENYTIRQYEGSGYMTKSWKLQALKGKKWVDIDAQSSESFCVVGILPVIKVKKTRHSSSDF